MRKILLGALWGPFPILFYLRSRVVQWLDFESRRSKLIQYFPGNFIVQYRENLALLDSIGFIITCQLNQPYRIVVRVKQGLSSFKNEGGTILGEC